MGGESAWRGEEKKEKEKMLPSSAEGGETLRAWKFGKKREREGKDSLDRVSGKKNLPFGDIIWFLRGFTATIYIYCTVLRNEEQRLLYCAYLFLDS